MSKRSVVVVGVLCCAPACLRGANIEYRLVETTGQTTASALDPILDFAVQGRVTGGGGLASWYLDSIRLVGDAEPRATLGRDRISNADGTYYTGAPAASSVVGQGGVASQYSFLATVSASFNGLINTSGGTFTNTPDNEIGSVSGYAGGGGLLLTPGVDPNMDGRPDSIVAPATSGSLPAVVMQTYFAQDEFVNLYRFRVAFTDLAARSVLIRLNGARGRSFTQVSLGTDGSLWGALQNSADAISTLDLTVQVVPAPGVGAGLALAGLGAGRRRRAR